MSDEAKWLEGATYVCEVPKELGAVTKIETKRGKVIVRTESGQTMIVPVDGRPRREP
jgi:hypothetical protein